jgi:hypothetical protein
MTGMTETRRWTGGRRGRARVAVGRLTAPRPLLWGVQARVERSTAAPEPGGAWKTSARSLVGMRGGGGWGGECRRDHGSRVAARPGGARVAGLRTGLLLTYGFFERAELPRGERFPRAPSGRIGGSLLTSGRPWAPRRVPPSPLGASWRARTSRTRARVSMYGWDSARGQDGDPTARGGRGVCARARLRLCACVWEEIGEKGGARLSSTSSTTSSPSPSSSPSSSPPPPPPPPPLPLLPPAAVEPPPPPPAPPAAAATPPRRRLPPRRRRHQHLVNLGRGTSTDLC